ncbi:uncharacterized protein BXZ73DRAFT_85804 [Epithele typhae]|uniref:uncharacterized protein n=1 Tax=Epithele typhae TaxID=378194 RepID=UPI002007D9C4|nr:uncharacterized protein BXZ73DRAFT_85804 [Epithele typhae]KAH9897615.1 hypothetical protein BXZ73DRAFT_85804 [Epithele typhae]
MPWPALCLSPSHPLLLPAVPSPLTFPCWSNVLQRLVFSLWRLEAAAASRANTTNYYLGAGSNTNSVEGSSRSSRSREPSGEVEEQPAPKRRKREGRPKVTENVGRPANDQEEVDMPDADEKCAEDAEKIYGRLHWYGEEDGPYPAPGSLYFQCLTIQAERSLEEAASQYLSMQLMWEARPWRPKRLDPENSVRGSPLKDEPRQEDAGRVVLQPPNPAPEGHIMGSWAPYGGSRRSLVREDTHWQLDTDSLQFELSVPNVLDRGASAFDVDELVGRQGSQEAVPHVQEANMTSPNMDVEIELDVDEGGEGHGCERVEEGSEDRAAALKVQHDKHDIRHGLPVPQNTFDTADRQTTDAEARQAEDLWDSDISTSLGTDEARTVFQVEESPERETARRRSRKPAKRKPSQRAEKTLNDVERCREFAFTMGTLLATVAEVAAFIKSDKHDRDVMHESLQTMVGRLNADMKKANNDDPSGFKAAVLSIYANKDKRGSQKSLVRNLYTMASYAQQEERVGGLCRIQVAEVTEMLKENR